MSATVSSRRAARTAGALLIGAFASVLSIGAQAAPFACPAAVAGAHVVDELEDYFSDTQWTCPLGQHISPTHLSSDLTVAACAPSSSRRYLRR